MRVKPLVRSWIAATTLFLATLSSAFAVPYIINNASTDGTAPAGLVTVNLAGDTYADSMRNAETFAQQFIVARKERLRKAGDTDPEAFKKLPVFLLHVGDEIPESTKWVAIHLHDAGIKDIKMMAVTRIEIEETLDQAKEEALKRPFLLHYDAPTKNPDDPVIKKRRDSIIEIWRRAKILAKRVSGLPNGFSIFLDMKREPKYARIQAGVATFNATLTGSVAAITFHLTENSGTPVNILPAVAFITSWVWINSYGADWIDNFINQSRFVRETKKGVSEVGNKPMLTQVGIVFKSLIGNALLQACAFGWDEAFTQDALTLNLSNTALTVTSRLLVDGWLAKRKAMINPDGTITVDAAKGQWKLLHWHIVNSAWYLAYTITKNLHLMGISQSTDSLFYMMAAAGAMKLAFEERHTFEGHFKRAYRWIRGIKVDQCNTLLLDAPPPISIN